MENAERLVNKTAEIHEFASEVARMITGAQMPEFSSENISVADASKLIGLPATSIRAGIVYVLQTEYDVEGDCEADRHAAQ